MNNATEAELGVGQEHGAYQLRFEQRRPWERGGAAHRTHTLTLHVR